MRRTSTATSRSTICRVTSPRPATATTATITRGSRSMECTDERTEQSGAQTTRRDADRDTGRLPDRERLRRLADESVVVFLYADHAHLRSGCGLCAGAQHAGSHQADRIHLYGGSAYKRARRPLLQGGHDPDRQQYGGGAL